MNGKGDVRFSDMFKDTVETHGWEYAHKHYVLRGKMPEWEWLFWEGHYWGHLR